MDFVDSPPLYCIAGCGGVISFSGRGKNGEEDGELLKNLRKFQNLRKILRKKITKNLILGFAFFIFFLKILDRKGGGSPSSSTLTPLAKWVCPKKSARKCRKCGACKSLPKCLHGSVVAPEEDLFASKGPNFTFNIFYMQNL